MRKHFLFLSIAAILFASCKNDMNSGNNCATATDSLQQIITARDTRINGLLDSLKMMMPATGTDTTAMNAGTPGSENASATSSGATDRSYFKAKRAHVVPADLRKKYPGEFPEGSARILTEKDLKFLSEWGLQVMLNEIYARHGMRFTSSDLQNHFSRQGWYRGTTNDVSANLSSVERRNIEFIKQYKYTPQIPA